MVTNGRAVVDVLLEDLHLIRLPLVSPPRIDDQEGEKLTASIHSADPAHVRAPAAIADSAAPGLAPGHCAVAGRRALPHPSSARRGRIDRRLACSCQSQREDVYTAG